jgi:hypothetical protein
MPGIHPIADFRLVGDDIDLGGGLLASEVRAFAQQLWAWLMYPRGRYGCQRDEGRSGYANTCYYMEEFLVPSA